MGGFSSETVFYVTREKVKHMQIALPIIKVGYWSIMAWAVRNFIKKNQEENRGCGCSPQAF